MEDGGGPRFLPAICDGKVQSGCGVFSFTRPKECPLAAPGLAPNPPIANDGANDEERAMQHMQTIKSDIPVGMTVQQYRRTLRRRKRHSPIRRLASFGLLR